MEYKTVNELCDQAEALILCGGYEKGIEILRAAFNEEPGNRRVRNRFLKHVQDPKERVEIFKKTADTTEHYVDVFDYANALIACGDDEKGIQILLGVFDKYPNDVDFRDRLRDTFHRHLNNKHVRDRLLEHVQDPEEREKIFGTIPNSFSNLYDHVIHVPGQMGTKPALKLNFVDCDDLGLITNFSNDRKATSKPEDFGQLFKYPPASGNIPINPQSVSLPGCWEDVVDCNSHFAFAIDDRITTTDLTQCWCTAILIVSSRGAMIAHISTEDLRDGRVEKAIDEITKCREVHCTLENGRGIVMIPPGIESGESESYMTDVEHCSHMMANRLSLVEVNIYKYGKKVEEGTMWVQFVAPNLPLVGIEGMRYWHDNLPCCST